MLDRFMTPRQLLCRGVKSDAVLPIVSDKQAESKPPKDSKNPNSKNQAKRVEKQRLAEAKRAQKSREKEAKASAST
jgi:tryptophanyl-tRNA synthetase